MHTLKTIGTAAVGWVLLIGCGGKAAREGADAAGVDGGSTAVTVGGAGGTGTTESPAETSLVSGVGGSSVSGVGGSTVSVTVGGDGWVTTTGTACFNCECSPTLTPMAMDDASRFGFSANDVLAFAGGTHQATVSYGTDLGVAAVVFPSESATLELQLEPLGTANDITDTRIPETAPYCGRAIGIDVKGTLTSGDGAFAEEFTGTLTAISLDFARLSVPLSLADLTGSYSPQVELVAPHSVDLSGELELAFHFGPGVFAGEVLADYTWCYQGYCMTPSVTSISSWGYCPFGGFQLDTAEDPRVALSDVLDTWDSIPEMEAVWADESASPLTIDLSVDETGLCREPGGYRVHAQLALSTEDGRLATNLGADVAYSFDDYSRSLYITGPTGESDESVDRFQLGYWSQLDAPIITLNGSVVLSPMPGEAEEISFR